MVLEFRNRCPDELLPWIDAAIVLAGDDTFFPPMLGTGGNDGRLEFSTNFHQRLLDVIGTSAATGASLGARDLLAGTRDGAARQRRRSASSTPAARAAPGRRGSARRRRWPTRGATSSLVEGAVLFAVERRPPQPARRGPGRDAVHRQPVAGRIGQRRGRRGIAR